MSCEDCDHTHYISVGTMTTGPIVSCDHQKHCTDFREYKYRQCKHNKRRSYFESVDCILPNYTGSINFDWEQGSCWDWNGG